MRRWFDRDRHERDLDDEIRFHLAEEARLREDAGASRDDARAAARRAFGNVTLVTAATRATWGRRLFEEGVQDVRHGFRLLARHRTFSIFAVLSLALGIGGTSAVFSLYDAIVLRPLPVAAPESLVTLRLESEGRRSNSFMPYPQFEAMRATASSVEGLFARSPGPNLSLGADGTAAIASSLAVTGEYHGTLGLQPAVGRLLLPADDRSGRAAVAVISHAYWQRRFGGRGDIVGRGVLLNGVPFTLVGVEPAGFFGVTVGSSPDITIPLRAVSLLSGREPGWDAAFSTWIEVMGRLKAGVPIERAAVELDGIFRRASLDAAAGRTADSDEARFAKAVGVGISSGATGGVSGLRARYEHGLQILLFLLGGVLCLASLNVAALLLSRAEVRREEIATRLALGAGRKRIVRQLLTESAIIAMCGGALGLLLASQAGPLLLRMATPNAPVLPVDLSPDLRVVAFTAIVSMASCLAFGLLPAARATASVRGSSRSELGGRRRRLVDRSLVLVQTALALVLVVCAGLFLRTLQNLWAQDTGYDRRNVLMFSVDAGLVGKRDAAARDLYLRILDDLDALPMARGVTLSTVRPVSDTYYFIDRVTRVADAPPANAADGIRIAVNHLAPGYFQMMRVPLRAGREFDRRDGPDAPKVAIISERLGRHFTGNPVGQRLTVGVDDVREVVGVAADVRHASVKDAPREIVYVPFFQGLPRFTPTFEIKYEGASTADVLRAVGDTVAHVDQGLAIFGAKTLEAGTAESFARERLLALLSSYLAGFAWLLAGVGLYGLLACTVAQRTREFGLRMALGAPPSRIRHSVLRESAGMVLAGVCVGLAILLPTVRLVRAQLFGLEPTDPTAFVVAVIVLVALAAVASYLPARRASRIDPMTALRQE
jgi:predicted permease